MVATIVCRNVLFEASNVWTAEVSLNVDGVPLASDFILHI